MTIQRSKRPPRLAGLGRPRKLTAPPPAIGGLNVNLELFKPTDIQELADATRLSLASNGSDLLAASVINEAFSHFANAAAMQIDDSPAGERRDWCTGIAKAAAELRCGLGHSGHCLFMEPSAFDAGESLKKGLPADPQMPEAQALQLAFSFAMPDKHKQANAEDPIVVADPEGGMWDLLGRLNAGLHALSLLGPVTS